MLERLQEIYSIRPDLAALLALLLGALAAYWFGKKVLVRAVQRLAGATVHTWDDALIEHRVPSRLAQLLPVFIIYAGVDWLPRFEGPLEEFLLKATGIYMVLVVTFALTCLLYTSDAADE